MPPNTVPSGVDPSAPAITSIQDFQVEGHRSSEDDQKNHEDLFSQLCLRPWEHNDEGSVSLLSLRHGSHDDVVAMLKAQVIAGGRQMGAGAGIPGPG